MSEFCLQVTVFGTANHSSSRQSKWHRMACCACFGLGQPPCQVPSLFAKGRTLQPRIAEPAILEKCYERVACPDSALSCHSKRTVGMGPTTAICSSVFRTSYKPAIVMRLPRLPGGVAGVFFRCEAMHSPRQNDLLV